VRRRKIVWVGVEILFVRLVEDVEKELYGD
jgi:hypothetical protein